MRGRRAERERVAELTRQRIHALQNSANLTSPEVDLRDPSSSDPEPPPTATGGSNRRQLGGRHARPALSPSVRVTAQLTDRLPVGLQGLWTLRRGEVLLLLGLLGTVVLVSLWTLQRERAAQQVLPVAAAPAVQGVPLAEAMKPAEPAEAAAQAVEALQGPESTVIVDVAGRVRRPGVLELPAGSRVHDAIKAAGGAKPGVRLTALNQARVLIDGEQIVVGAGPASTALGPVSSPGASQLVSLNSADQVALETLPGVGPVTAEAIISWRTANGGFTAIDDLLDVDGIGEATLEKLRPHVTL